MKRRRLPEVPITSPEFRYHNAASHNASSEEFKKRQQERIARVQAKPEVAANSNVAPLSNKRAGGQK